MRVAFYMPQNTKCKSHFSDSVKLQVLFCSKFTLLKMEDYSPWRMISMGILREIVFFGVQSTLVAKFCKALKP